MSYRTPSTLPHALQALPSEEERARLLQECRDADAANAAAWDQMREQFRALKAQVQDVLGYQHHRFRPADPLRVWMSKGPLEGALPRRAWTSLMQEAFENLERKAKDATRAEQDRAAKLHRDLKPARAVLFLIKHGMVEGRDFTPETAVQVADRFAFDSAVARRLQEGGLISFSGEDYCEDCGGWDGTSNRCECGNRRVSWTTDCDFEAFDAGAYHVYGEAH